MVSSKLYPINEAISFGKEFIKNHTKNTNSVWNIQEAINEILDVEQKKCITNGSN